MSGTLTYLTDAIVRDNKVELDGRVLTRPALVVTDGLATLYAIDVDIGIVDATGYDETLDLDNIPVVGTVLHNVPIARGNDNLIYADVGSAVRLRRSASGRYEVVGFSQQMPGTNIRFAVNLTDFTFGPIEDLTYSSRALTLGELSTMGTFGITPLGAIAIFRGSTLIEIR